MVVKLSLVAVSIFLPLALLGAYLVYRASSGPELVLRHSVQRIATVNGQPVTHQEIARIVWHLLDSDVEIMADQARKLALSIAISDAAFYGEAVRRGLVPTDEELTEYIRPMREACAVPDSNGCKYHISEVWYGMEPGFSVEDVDHWLQVEDFYRRELGRGKLHTAEMDKEGWPLVPEAVLTRDHWTERILDEAEIVWHDENMRQLYEAKWAAW